MLLYQKLKYHEPSTVASSNRIVWNPVEYQQILAIWSTQHTVSYNHKTKGSPSWDMEYHVQKCAVSPTGLGQARVLVQGPCQGPFYGGSYMDEGTSHIRIGLFPAVVSGDYLASPSCSIRWSLAHVQCQMIQGCTIVCYLLLFPIHVCAPEGYPSWSCVHPLSW